MTYICTHTCIYVPGPRLPALAFGRHSLATVAAVEGPKAPPRQPKYGAAAKTLVECSCMYSLSNDQPKYVATEIWNQNSGPPGPDFLFQISSSFDGVNQTPSLKGVGGEGKTLGPYPPGDHPYF